MSLHAYLPELAALLGSSCYPPGTRAVDLSSYRPGYRAFPARLTVRAPDGKTDFCVVKDSDHLDLMREAQVLRALAEVGLPVPEVRAGPVALAADFDSGPPSAPGPGSSVQLAKERPCAMLLMSEMPGRPLPWLGLSSLAEADLSCRLLLEGVRRLHQLTSWLQRHEIAAALPHRTLSDELDAIERRGGVLDAALGRRAVDLLRGAMHAIEVPLVFSNGDYNPLNFLYDGTALTGWIDFEGACFEDPHVGFAKFLIWAPDEYGWGTGVKVGLVERWLYTCGISRREFAPRLALRCLRDLQDALSGDTPHTQCDNTLRLLEESLSGLGR